MKKIDIYDLSFNNLEQEERLELLKPTFKDPFNLPKDVKRYNPFTFKGIDTEGNECVWDNGEHIMHNIWTLKIYRKVLVEDSKVIKVYKVSTNNEYEEVLPHKDGTWDVSLF